MIVPCNALRSLLPILVVIGSTRSTLAAPRNAVPNVSRDSGELVPDTGQPNPSAQSRGVAPVAESSRESTSAYDEARSLYLSGRFEQCVDAFSGLLNPEHSRPVSEPRLIERGRLYYAACLMGLGRDVDAQEQMRAAIRANPRMLPPSPLIFPAPVVSKFAAVHSALLDEIQASEDRSVKRAQEEARAAQARAERETLRVQVLEELAASETLVEQNRRWIAAVPFGVGQFQNGDTLLGWLFFGGEALLGGATVTAASLELLFHSQASRQNVDEQQFNSRVRLVNRIQDFGLIGFGALALAGIVEAELNFVPERTVGTRQRVLPKSLADPSSVKDLSLRWAPELALSRDMLSAGISGIF